MFSTRANGDPLGLEGPAGEAYSFFGFPWMLSMASFMI
jgi:hypothetical protein